MFFEKPLRSHQKLSLGRARSDPRARMGNKLLHRFRHNLLLRSCLSNEPGQQMLTFLLGRGGRSKNLLGGHAVQANHVSQLEPAFCQGAGLVEGECIDFGQALER